MNKKIEKKEKNGGSDVKSRSGPTERVGLKIEHSLAVYHSDSELDSEVDISREHHDRNRT